MKDITKILTNQCYKKLWTIILIGEYSAVNQNVFQNRKFYKISKIIYLLYNNLRDI